METLTRDKGASAFAPDGALVATPCAMVIFGAAGNLTKRLVVPALYNLVKAERLPNEFQLVGVDLASKTAEEWRTGLTQTMQEFVGADGEFAVDYIDQTAWQWLTERMSYLQGDLNNPQTYRSLDAHSGWIGQGSGDGRQPPVLSGNRRPLLNPPRDFPNYIAGGNGPAAADELLARDGRVWRPLA
jgi:glucose-6-phosphate 1-dehydrogenase